MAENHTEEVVQQHNHLEWEVLLQQQHDTTLDYHDEGDLSEDNDASKEEEEQGEKQEVNPEHQDYLEEALHVPIDNTFNFSQEDELEFYQNKLPQVFQDHPEIFHNVLEGLWFTISQAAAKHSEDEYPGLNNFIHTVPIVLKQLGLTMNDFIVYLCICNVCWVVHHPFTISDLTLPGCTVNNCLGVIYREKRLANGQLKHTPVKTVPYIPLECAIQLLLLRPGKWEQLQHWRGPGNQLGPCLPSIATGYNVFQTLTHP
ncbi:hypothetical protein CONPUDRAFT_68842 [Coniophora puteana RWD-64-598 SS2]|uniref:Uncharacterized protein n=1 Tax=Coniophora puteana (strain RWD-64-598) TaxID=741705 RepID=A0A5M3N4W5_CONPW|nr:uncharacterized protein CONPUDRAFT_68842 [Coniophora puteana RWD-64-598 SS2]EIW86287.1 hypothetical protein CONPUDRAFT_68842 [Coniophora puteana RWD-64-598 SS2]